MIVRNTLFSAAFAIAVGAFADGCVVVKSADLLVSTPRAVPNKIEHPKRDDARLAVLWIGHATTLIQIDDVFILTDPVFTRIVGELSARLVEPGLDPANLPQVNVVLISHLHFDHLSLDTLDMIQHKIDRLYVPKGGFAYLPDYSFESHELGWWKSDTPGARPGDGVDGLKITAVPVQHNGMRYGVDIGWMKTSFTGYVIQYHGITVYYGGDTAFNAKNFSDTSDLFPRIDLALLPIGPIQPRAIMESMHEDPVEALDAMRLLHAKTMIPIHFDTFLNSADDLADAPRLLDAQVKARHLEEKVFRLGIGQQKVVIAK
jgi:L-ascorbate metabolism protein UlaG (beta-lactamase superfamily)